MRDTIIFDLDGTLALIDERRALAAKANGKINWKTFFDPKNMTPHSCPPTHLTASSSTRPPAGLPTYLPACVCVCVCTCVRA